MHHAAKKPKSEEALSELESRAHALFTRLDVNKDGEKRNNKTHSTFVFAILIH